MALDGGYVAVAKLLCDKGVDLNIMDNVCLVINTVVYILAAYLIYGSSRVAVRLWTWRKRTAVGR